MSSSTKGMKRLRQNLRLTGPIVILSVGVLLPVLLSTAVGIVTLVIGEGSESIILGVLTISFTSAAIGSAIIVTVLLGRRSRLARLQGDLLANVSHELRTPLSSIRMYAQMLQLNSEREGSEQARQSIDTIVRETEWLEAMIDRLLTWRAAAKDRFQLNMTLESISPALEAAKERFERMLPPNEVDFESRIATNLPVLHDTEAIGLLTLNLLVNAYKYTRNDKRIRLEALESDQEIEISVTDNGVGIPENETKRVFEPFYRVRSSQRAAGAGLGLAIVRHIASAHGGEVGVQSTVGKGSRFTVRLPKARSAEAS